MITRVYVWRPTPLRPPPGSGRGAWGWSWGHASGAVLAPVPGAVPHLYWSYWPDETKPGRCVYSYAEDVETMGRPAAVAIDIPGLDPAAMEEAWERELGRAFSNLAHNCCTVTHEILAAGYRARLFGGVGAFAEGCWRSLWAGFASPVQSGTAHLAALQGRAVFDPDAVERIARHLRELCKP